MNPKEKAKELSLKYAEIGTGEINNPDETAVESAIICVNEILEDNPNIYDSDRLNFGYWNNVKRKLIERLNELQR